MKRGEIVSDWLSFLPFKPMTVTFNFSAVFIIPDVPRIYKNIKKVKLPHGTSLFVIL